MSKSPAASLPRHLGLIIDGNRRWAQKKGLASLEGHKAGYDNLKTIARAAINRGVEYVSAYVFSTENWNRTKTEIKYLMDLAMTIFETDIEQLHKDGVRVRVAGSRQRLNDRLAKAIDAAELKTKANTKGTIVLCFNYGGQQEIADAFSGLRNSKVSEITPADIDQHLYAPDVPPVDFIIRTSGEQRLSNFMLWRAAYAELLFVNKHWPDFGETDLDSALADYARRQRRFGK